MQNESETEFHRVYKVSPTQQLTKLTHLLRESGAAVLLVQWFRHNVSSSSAVEILNTERKVILLF